VDDPGVTDQAAYVPVPVFLVGDLEPVVDDQVAALGMALLAVLIAHPSVGLGGIA
jgi:hypothetical protein